MDPTTKLDALLSPRHNTLSKNHKVGAANKSNLSKQKSPGAKSSQSRHMHAVVLDTTKVNVLSPLVSCKVWLTALGCLKAKGLPFCQCNQVSPVYLYEVVKHSGPSN